jgi:hypothetical protein
MKTACPERTITPTEAAVIRWLPDNAPIGDVTAYRALPVEELRVVGGCDCGCSTLDFQPHAWGPGSAIIADAYAVYPDGKTAGLILWAREGEIASLEVYDCHPEASHRAPEVSDLRNFAGPAERAP